MDRYSTYTVTCPYFKGGDNTRSNDEGLAMVAEINKMASDQGYSTERDWFEARISEYDPEGLWGLEVEENANAEFARADIVAWVRDHGPAVVEGWAKEKYNCREAGIDDDGDIWIAEPQAGHWLNDETLIEFARWVSAQ